MLFSHNWRSPVLLLILLCVALTTSLFIPSVRRFVRSVVPELWIVHVNGFRLGYRADYDVRISMPDGVQLAASLYRPSGPTGKLGTVLVRLPYGRLKYGEGLRAAEFFAANGYAVLIQDMRGTFGSGGEFVPYRFGTSDGVATLDWIVAQSWSNGKVGTYGCSALGEIQYVLARARHPAHAAMIPIGAGGAMGAALGRYSYFGVFEGGIFQLSSGFGWFLENGAKVPSATAANAVDIAAALRGLPVVDLVKRARTAPNSYEEFVRTPLTDPYWKTLDYVSDDDRLVTPALIINTWGDQTLGDTLALAKLTSDRSPSSGLTLPQHVVIAPGTHCHHEETGMSGEFGDLKLGDAGQPYFEWYLQWFDYWLRGKGSGLSELPAYLYYVLGENRWLTASSWPPEGVRIERWYLDSGGHANSVRGDGTLSRALPQFASHDEFRYDPMHPVPSRGGPLCCSGIPADRAGPVDQHEVEERDDVLIYTSPIQQEPLRIAGPLRAMLSVSSSARDTDFVARLVHVWPDGRATNIQEGALRARYRHGIDQPALLTPGQLTELTIDMRSIAYLVPKGHRFRLHITSSSFPRLERNLNTGGRNYDESIGVIAVNHVHHDKTLTSFLELPVLP